MNQSQLCIFLLSTVIGITASFSSISLPASRRTELTTAGGNVKDTADAVDTTLRLGFLDPEFFRRGEVSGDIGDQPPLDVDDEFVLLGSFPVEGQGAIGIKFVVEEGTEEVQFRFDPDECSSNSPAPDHPPHPILHTISNKDGWTVKDVVTNEVLGNAPPTDNGLPLLNNGRNETFWMSFDKENLILRGGTGYMITALELVNKAFNASDPTVRETYAKNYGMLQRYSIYKPDCVMKNGEYKLFPSKYPIYKDLPPIVKAHEEISLEDLDTGSAISIKELSPECQRLYENVAGANIRIDPPDFPDFAQAIDHSINFGFCKEKLAQKAKGEFKNGGSEYDANETYLRITLGSNAGDSPGIPYVMEIWPPGCYSPIHDHSQANAIIKVLHGSLTTRWYESLDRVQQEKLENPRAQVKPYDQAVVSKGDVTWLDDRQFQTHQLFNHNVDGTACVTIQCYMYNDSDNSHYENFDYVGGGGDSNIYPFVPNSDFDYGVFKCKLQHEFSEYKREAEPKPDFKTLKVKED